MSGRLVVDDDHGLNLNKKKTIRPPTTVEDDGNPSNSCSHDMDRVLRLIEDERHFTAQQLLHDIQRRIGYDNTNKTNVSGAVVGTPTPSPTNEDSNSNATTTGKRRLRLRPPFHRQEQQHQTQTTAHQKQKDVVKDHELAKELMETNHDILQTLEDRCLLFTKAKQNLNVDDDWTLAQTLFGVTTHYRRERDGSLSIKLEGTIDGVPLFDQVAVLREVDLHSKWAPFCSSSLTIAHLDKLDTVGWFVVGLPHFGLMRDGCFRAIGCDSIYEDGSVLLVAQGINDKPEDGAERQSLTPTEVSSSQTKKGSTNGINDTKTSNDLVDNKDDDSVVMDPENKRIAELLSNDPILDTLDIPAPPTRMGSGRMTMKTFQAMIHVDSPTSATCKIVANIDPNLPLIPQSMLDFIMKRLCGVLMSKLQGTAKKISKDPVTNPHAIKMREEQDFYKGWLMEKFRGVAKVRGWEEPQFAVFDLSDAQLDLAEAYNSKKKRKTQKTIKLYHSMTDDNLDDYLEHAPQEGIDAASAPAHVGQSGPVSDGGSGPRVRARAVSDGDSLSDLSRNSAFSSNLWRSNPVSSYLRDLEEKTQRRKEKEIQKSRQRAASRLKPKELDIDSRSRLDELRQARALRNSQTHVTTSHVTTKSNGVDSRSGNSNQKAIKNRSSSNWAIFWTKNGSFTRIVVITSLVVTLFYLLFMCTYFEEFAFSQDGSFLLRRGRDVATVLYMTLVGISHFSLMYVALMYSFSSLQIGTIAGKEAKKFYSDNVHLILYVMSGGMVVLGFVKAVVSKSLEWIIWNAVKVWRLVVGSSVVTSLEESFETYVAVPYQDFGIGQSVSVFAAFLQRTCVESNVIGRTTQQMIGLFLAIPLKGIEMQRTMVETTVNHYEGVVPTESWREDAFTTSRGFLAYSAVFLLVLLFLFNTSARHARSFESIELEEEEEDNAEENSPPVGLELYETKTNSISSNLGNTSSKKSENNGVNGRTQFKFNRSLSPDFDTIEEEEDNGGGEDVTSRNASSSTGTGRLKMLRFRHNRAKSSSM